MRVPLERDTLLRRQRRVLGRGGFRTVWLNVAGWAALVGTGLAAGAIVTLATRVPPAAALPAGVVLTWAVLLLLDYRRWRKGTVGVGSDFLDEATGNAIVARLRELGIETTYREDVFDDEDGNLYTQRSIVCRNPDAPRVAAVLDELRPAP